MVIYSKKSKKINQKEKEEKKKKRLELKNISFSKKATFLTMLFGFIVAQECLVLIAYAIYKGFSATAAYLTAAIGLAEAVIIGAQSSYISLNKKEKTVGGITYAAAEARGFVDHSQNSPPI